MWCFHIAVLTGPLFEKKLRFIPLDTLIGTWRKSLTAIAQECFELYSTNPEGNIPENSSCTATYLPSRKPSKLDEPVMRDTAGEVRMNS